MKMQEQVQQLQTQLNSLKVRLFDAQEATSAQNTMFSEFIQNLVNVMGVTGDEHGNVTLDMVTARAQELVANEAVPVADNVVPFTQPIAPEAE